MIKRSSPGRASSTRKSERRDTPRIPIALEAVLHYNNQQLRHSLTRDISLDGAFVETREALAQKGSVELAISLPTDGKPQFHHFQAQVVRVADGGAGLLFDKVGTEAYAALLDLVFSRQGRGLW
ncbi:MAG: PilZ domain-containing protein [Gammaproteobacteria bacterium]